MFRLNDPYRLPNASAFLWNKVMMIQATCRGYATAQFMQPEPSKYSHAPNLEMKTFMQPEQPYYVNHPGRFVYIKDEESGTVFSAPYEPVRNKPDRFEFVPGLSHITWRAGLQGIEVEMTLSLPTDEPLELWTVRVSNTSGRTRKISVYPSFTVGYMSWMNQSGEYLPEANAIVCSCVTPYQKYQDYEIIKRLKDKTFFISEREPNYYEVSQSVFEGEGGVWNPDGVGAEHLANSVSRYEMPCAVFQHQISLAQGEMFTNRYLFGAAKTDAEVRDIRARYFNGAENDGFTNAVREYQEYILQGKGCINIQTPDETLNEFVNQWLPRQIYYHGSTNRLTTDPQTRNYIQDGMGMVYIKPETARDVFVTSLRQQKSNGEMPDGILLGDNKELKYINTIPHTDHCVWLPICLSAYLNETNDYEFLDMPLPYQDGGEDESVYAHICRAMDWLLKNRDGRGLSYINQGDWCDPMNMVGYKGKGVSGWLTIAVSYALKVWSGICKENGRTEAAEKFDGESAKLNGIINRYLWDGDWYARGITDGNVVFGVSNDTEGRIYLNPQSFSLLCGAADENQKEKMLAAVENELETPYGTVMLAPPYTKMREDVGRVTQKFPGSAENGSVYNHAAVFYIYALYSAGEKENAYRLLRKMLPQFEDDFIRRGQLAVFIPNYYRGAYKLYPGTAGKSSHLFNTGTVSWYYRCLVEGLFGLKGDKGGLRIDPQLPDEWNECKVSRAFAGAVFNIRIKRISAGEKPRICVNGQTIEGNVIRDFKKDATYEVEAYVPMKMAARQVQ